jgi:cell fate regulator YaaT (PSP1 superfamily)
MVRQVTLEVAPGEQVSCACPERLAIHIGDRCLFEQGAGLESGLLIACTEGEAAEVDALPKLVRCETLQDQARGRENLLLARMAEETCRSEIQGLGLDMRLVRVRYSFDRKLLLVVFAAEERVDFRELVKRLAFSFHCRVELRQIGARDEAGLIGGLGICGQEQCCTRWLRHFESVNVRMARTQGLSLNPGAISGMCGRLKCCLRYEQDQYQDALRGLPRYGACVESPDGRGFVIELQILTGLVRVRLEDGRTLSYDAGDLRIMGDHSCCRQYQRESREWEDA